MRKGQRAVVKTCRCGCGQAVQPRYDKHGNHKGYNKCLPGHKPPMTEKFLAAWEKTRKSRYLPIGSKRVRRDGTPEGDYIEIKVRENGRWMLEHRWVMQQHIGRPLRTNEHVHHLDGNKKNNSIENLQLLSAVEHMSITAKEIVRNKQGLHQYTKCEHCGWRHPPHH